jgi:hypothetical protein
MPMVKAIIFYQPEDPPGFSSGVKFKITKKFYFKHLPLIESSIIIKNDAIDCIGFVDPEFDPEQNEYTVFGTTSENVHRYYRGDALEEMQPVLLRYKNHGWDYERV